MVTAGPVRAQEVAGAVAVGPHQGAPGGRRVPADGRRAAWSGEPGHAHTADHRAGGV